MFNAVQSKATTFSTSIARFDMSLHVIKRNRARGSIPFNVQRASAKATFSTSITRFKGFNSVQLNECKSEDRQPKLNIREPLNQL